MTSSLTTRVADSCVRCSPHCNKCSAVTAGVDDTLAGCDRHRDWCVLRLADKFSHERPRARVRIPRTLPHMPEPSPKPRRVPRRGYAAASSRPSPTIRLPAQRAANEALTCPHREPLAGRRATHLASWSHTATMLPIIPERPSQNLPTMPPAQQTPNERLCLGATHESTHDPKSPRSSRLDNETGLGDERPPCRHCGKPWSGRRNSDRSTSATTGLRGGAATRPPLANRTLTKTAGFGRPRVGCGLAGFLPFVFRQHSGEREQRSSR